MKILFYLFFWWGITNFLIGKVQSLPKVRQVQYELQEILLK